MLAGVAPAATLAGKVVEDHTNAPLALAGVRVIDVSTHTVIADLDTDRQGKFQAPPLQPGEYRLEISRPNFLDTTVRVQLSASGRTIAARLVRRVAFSGQVTDSQGQPIAGVFVFALPKPNGGAPAPPYGNLSSGSTGSTDAQGRYRLYGLPPGEYVVAVSYGASTMAVGQSGDASVKAGVGSGAVFYPGGSQPQVFALTGGEDVRNINFTAGQNLLFSVSGKVELPSSPFQVWLALTPSGQTALATAVTQAKADGSFRFEGIPAGQYHLFASGPAPARSGQGAFLGPKPLFARSLLSVAGQNVEGLSVTLAEPRTGTVSLAGNCGTGSVKVQLTALEDWAAVLSQTVDVATGHEQKVINLAPTRYQAKIQNPGAGCSQESVPVLDLTGPSDPVKVTLSAAGSVRGRLKGALAGDTTVALMSADGTGTLLLALPDEQARFEFADVKPGRYRIAARTGTGAAHSSLAGKEIEVRGGAPTEVELTPPEGANNQ